MKNLFIFLFLLTLFACESDPASISETPFPDSKSGVLSRIELSNADTLALAPTESQTVTRSAVSNDCQKLGELKGALYFELDTESIGGDIAPCFRGAAFWKQGSIYGQYRPDDSTIDVWFVTDAEGNVHHLPGPPRKGQGFKNEPLMKSLQGWPAYLGADGSLKQFNFTNATEETVLPSQYKRFEILDRQDGEHLVYLDQDGAGKRRRPDETIENFNEIEDTGFFFANASQDLTYKTPGLLFKNMILGESGEVVADASSVVPLARAEWMLDPIGIPEPQGPVIAGGMEGCEKQDDLMLCEGKGYLLTDSSNDLVEINWCDFEHCSWAGGYEAAKTCINENYFYFYSPGNQSPKLTKINRDLSEFTHQLTNIEVVELDCAEDGGVYVRGRNTDTSSDENFHYKDGIKTFLTKTVSEIIR